MAISDALGRRIGDVIGPQLHEQRRLPLEKALAGQRVEFQVESVSLGIRDACCRRSTCRIAPALATP